MRFDRESWVWRVVLLVGVCLICAATAVDWSRAPSEKLVAGDIAPRTVKAPVTFKYQDMAAYETARTAAEERELPVFVFQADAREEALINVHMAFANARAQLSSASGREHDPEQLRRTVVEQFNRDLRVHLVPEDVDALADAGFAVVYEDLVAELLSEALSGMVIADRADLPRDRGAIRVIQLGGAEEERVLEDTASVHTAPEARQQISLRALDSQVGDSAAGRASAAIARSLVRSNLSFSALKTEERKRNAVLDVRLQPESVKRGTVLFREGDTLSEGDVVRYEALQAQQGEQAIALAWGSIAAFLMLLVGIAYSFGASYLDRFETRLRHVASAAGLLVLTTLMARVAVAAAVGVSTLVGFEAEPESVWYVVPMAGAVMLVRLLMSIEWAVLFTVVASVTAGLVMEMSVLPVAFFTISGLTAAASVAHTRERIAVLRAGLQVALVNAATVLVIHFVQLYVVDGEVTLATTMRPVWSMSFALAGGVLSAFLVLGLTPAFESFGFVTDYRLMELANLNHPLMRQLMLRAPGSYHHSVMVGSLAEAAAEAVGANALQAKVAAYFHDIGKSLKPQYFVENQGKGGNRHEGLDPHTSAQIIISHVTEGGRMAAEHNLPKPIQDNIWMHHGTGILQFFYAKAAEQSPEVSEAPFRYPGPKPDTREAGIIMLADKVEAATRTIRSPTEDNIRAMISRIVSSVMADGQFSECPLTFQEIHTVADTFVTVLLGIYHQRIEYPQTAEISGGDATPRAVAKAGLITLELHTDRSLAPVDDDTDLEPLPPPVEGLPIAQGQQHATPTTPPPVMGRRRKPGEGDELPPPVIVAPDGTLGAVSSASDYEAVQYLPRGKD
ncbi:MAG: HDIG domain-containing protein [Alphaproteobacteria bacterium]|nr:HDIG domain-containing protein [Alphaproteobacteria bacterium]